MSRTESKWTAGSRMHCARAGLALIGLAGLAAGCSTLDLDGAPLRASPLPLGVWVSDALHCAGHDCVDWYEIVTPEKGAVRIEVRTEADRAAEQTFYVILSRPDGQLLKESHSGRGVRTRLQHKVERARYLVRVQSGQTNRDPLPYRLKVQFHKPQPPPKVEVKPVSVPRPPRFERVSWRVVEVEDRAGGERAVLFRTDRAEDLHAGMRGALMREGAAIGKVELTEVHPNGGVRARVEGPVAKDITRETRVEIAIPVEDSE